MITGSVIANDLVVGARNRDPSGACPARSQHCQESYRRQAAGHTVITTHFKRAGPSPERDEGLRRRWEDVIPSIFDTCSACTSPDTAIHRFVLSPRAHVEKRLSSEAGDLKSDINNLEKRLHYLETTHKNSRDNIDQILNSGGRA